MIFRSNSVSPILYSQLSPNSTFQNFDILFCALNISVLLVMITSLIHLTIKISLLMTKLDFPLFLQAKVFFGVYKQNTSKLVSQRTGPVWSHR